MAERPTPGRPMGHWARRACLLGVGLPALAAPALWNGYPLVFADTGTYVSQAVNHHLGWDRPVFYSFFLLALHARISLWPVVLAQAGLTIWLLSAARRALAPRLGPGHGLVILLVLAVTTALPWFASQIMPDLATGLLVLAIAVLASARLRAAEAWALSGFAAGSIAIHQSHLPLALGLIAALALARWAVRAPGWDRATWRRLAGAPVAAMLALLAMNGLGHHRLGLSPYGNVFLLARVLYDGPGFDALARDCPHPGWRLCAAIGHFPASADGFLWRADSPLQQAGGAKQVSREADGILAAAIAAEPWREARIALGHAARQFARFATGDGLQPWPAEVGRWIRRDFPPAEYARYAAARQTRGAWLVPAWLARLHRAAAIAGMLGCLGLIARWRTDRRAAGFAATVLLALALNAAITGALSGPHDRYQARIVWLAPYAALLGLARAGTASEPEADAEALRP